MRITNIIIDDFAKIRTKKLLFKSSFFYIPDASKSSLIKYFTLKLLIWEIWTWKIFFLVYYRDFMYFSGFLFVFFVHKFATGFFLSLFHLYHCMLILFVASYYFVCSFGLSSLYWGNYFYVALWTYVL